MSKYGNVKTNGYASKREAKRGFDLAMLQNEKHISQLAEQVRFELIPSQPGERPVHYVADFAYWQDGKYIVEDVKGMKTDVYIIKRKLMLYVHGIRIQEVK